MLNKEINYEQSMQWKDFITMMADSWLMCQLSGLAYTSKPNPWEKGALDHNFYAEHGSIYQQI